MIVRSRFEEVTQILKKHPKSFRLTNLDKRSDEVTIEILVQEIEANLLSTSQRIGEIEIEVLPSLGASASASYDLASSVPNISLRECRLWSQLNTKDFHEKLRVANGDKAKLAPIMNVVADMICARHVMNIPPLVVKLKRSGNMMTPYVIFICLGQNESGEKLHNLVHIGCTRECMIQWESLYKLRNAARNDRLGDATIQAWGDWYHRLVELDTYAGAGTEDTAERKAAVLKTRRALLQGDSNALPECGQKLLGEKLRACSTHLGQSFRQLEWAQVEVYPCCYLCKTTQAWNEVTDPKADEAANIELENRKKCPHSCAEVAASGYCDYITRQRR